MKKTQRSFAVEYKSGRRKTGSKPNSIWGDLDLQTVAREVEQSAMPMLPGGPAVDQFNVELSLPTANRRLPTLTLPTETLNAVLDTQEILMADENNIIANADAPAPAEAEPAPKQQRKPRTKRASAGKAKTETVAGPDGGNVQKKRGRKPKALEAALSVKPNPIDPSPKNEQPAAVQTTSIGEEMADLLQLEEENQKLRRLLAEKLRAENADLRKKLKLD